MATELIGILSWMLQTDQDGYRTYTLIQLVKAGIADGPYNVSITAGLPIPGVSLWNYEDDFDGFAVCQPDTQIRIHQERKGDPNEWWEVENTFSTKPNSLCKDEQFGNGDPLLQPQVVNGGTSRFQEEATHDRFGVPCTNSAHEQFHGPQIEFDEVYDTVHIEQNVPLLELEVCNSLKNTVNDDELWGVPRRCIRLTNFTWEKLYYGTCYAYYRRVFDFEIRYFIKREFKTFFYTPVSQGGLGGDRTLAFANGIITSGHDRDLLDEGTKVLNGRWIKSTDCAGGNNSRWVLQNVIDPVTCASSPPDRANPTHFIRYKDPQGENTRVILNGFGVPAEPDATEQNKWWCIADGSVPTCFNGTCADALTAAKAAEATLFGPYDTESECTTNCAAITAGSTDGSGVTGGATISSTVTPVTTCPGGGPGYIHIEKYDESDFLQLGIPITF